MLSGLRRIILCSSWFGTKTTMNQAARSNPATRCRRSSMARISRPAITTPHIVIIIFSRPSPTHLTLRDQITRRRPRRFRAFSVQRPRRRRRQSPARPTAAPIRRPPRRRFPAGASRATRSRCRSMEPSQAGAGRRRRVEFHADLGAQQRQPHDHGDAGRGRRPQLARRLRHVRCQCGRRSDD